LTAGKRHGHARWEELEFCSAGMAASIEERGDSHRPRTMKVDRDDIAIMHECNISDRVVMKKVVQLNESPLFVNDIGMNFLKHCN